MVGWWGGGGGREAVAVWCWTNDACAKHLPMSDPIPYPGGLRGLYPEGFFLFFLLVSLNMDFPTGRRT